MIEATKLAWAAGIVDGEGCIRLVRRSRYGKSNTYSLNVAVVNTDLRMLTALHLMFGGTVKDYTYGRNKRQTWVWQVSTKVAAAALRQILPYMVSKRDQAELALLSREFLRHSRHDDASKLAKQAELASQISELKKPRLEVVRLVRVS